MNEQTTYCAYCPANGDAKFALSWQQAEALAQRLQGATGAAWVPAYRMPELALYRVDAGPAR